MGDLGLRLHHKEEAKEAYQRCLDTTRYAQKPWGKLLEMFAEEGDITRTIQTAIRVAAYQYADYTEMTVSFLWLSVGGGTLNQTTTATVPLVDRPVIFQTGSDPRTRQDCVHVAQYGTSGPGAQDHGWIFAVWQDIQGGGV